FFSCLPQPFVILASHNACGITTFHGRFKEFANLTYKTQWIYIWNELGILNGFKFSSFDLHCGKTSISTN
ncbi:hypothetical protein ACJX0J_026641, partial [Zea mays]